MERRKVQENRGGCEHAAYPVEVLPVGVGGKKIAYCLGCGRAGPARASLREALLALREEARPFFHKTG